MPPAKRQDGAASLPVPIEPLAAYTTAQVRALLNLAATTLKREIAEGRIRYSMRSGRRYFLGEWLIEWIRSGEVSRRGEADK